MELSSRLNLKKPQVTDDIHQTIEWLSENFDTIDENFDETISDINTFLTENQTYNSGKKFWNRTPSLDGFVGWTNIRTGVFAPKWKEETTYNIGDIVTMSDNDGHYYVCVVDGTSGVNEPLFSPTSESNTSDLNGATFWTASYSYQVDDIVVPNDGDGSYFYKCIQSGTSNDTEPSWTSISGSTVVDGTVAWRAYKTVQWREGGVSCEFVPFGRVDSLVKPTTKYTQTIGDDNGSTTFIINHNLDTQDVVVMIREMGSPYSKVDADVKVTDKNSIVVNFESSPTKNQYRVVIIG